MKCVPPYVQQASNHSHNVTPKALFLSEPIYTKLILMLIVLFIDLCYTSIDIFFSVFYLLNYGPFIFATGSVQLLGRIHPLTGPKGAYRTHEPVIFLGLFHNPSVVRRGRTGRSVLAATFLLRHVW